MHLAFLIVLAATLPQEKPADPAPSLERKVRELGAVRFSHNGPLTALAVSPDGRTIATGDDKTLKLWDFESGRMIHEAVLGARVLVFSKDGARIVAGTAAGGAVIDSTNGAVVTELMGHARVVLGAAFSPDASRVATASDDATVRVWDSTTGMEAFRIEEHLNTVFAVAYSPDGSLLASGSRDGTVRLWRADTGKPVRTLSGHGGDVRAISFSADGKTLISAGGDDLRISGEDDRSIRLWDVDTGAAKGSWSGHAKAVKSLALSRDGTTLASGTVDGEVKVWEFPSGRVISTSRAGLSVSGLALLPDGKRLAIAGGAQTPAVFDATEGREVAAPDGHRSAIQALKLHPDGDRLIAGDMSGEILVWSLKSGKTVRRLTGQGGAIVALAVSPDGKRLASSGSNKRVVIRTLDDGQEVVRIPIQTEWGMSLAWWPDGGTVAVNATRRDLQVFDAKTGKILPPPPIGTVEGVAFSPDGKSLGCIEGYGAVRLRDAADGHSRASMASSLGLASVAFSPDGRFLVACGSGFGVLDVESGRTSDLSKSIQYFYRPVFSPDGRRLAAYAWNRGLETIETVSAEVICRIPMKLARLPAVAFLPDSRTVAVGTEDAGLSLWNVWPESGDISGKTPEELWKLLAAGPTEALPAVDALVAIGEAAVEFLKKELGSPTETREAERLVTAIAGAEGEAIKKLLSDLVELGGPAEAVLDRAIESSKDEKVRMRLTHARDELLAPVVKSPATLRRIRAQEILERIGSKDCLSLLKSLARSAPSRRERGEAAEAVKRMEAK